MNRNQGRQPININNNNNNNKKNNNADDNDNDNNNNEYDVSNYTDEELYELLDMHPNVTDGELEAKLNQLIRHYESYGNEWGDRLADFYEKVMDHFFSSFDSEEEEEEEHYNKNKNNNNKKSGMREGFTSGTGGRGTTTMASGTYTRTDVLVDPNNPQQQYTANRGNVLSMDSAYRENDTLLTKPLDYTKDNLNPLLTQTIRRIISIDSQYRENKGNSYSTEFIFNLSEPLRDVVSLKLYSFTIPYNWYTVGNAFGANFFYIKGNVPGLETGAHDYQVSVTPGYYDATSLVNATNEGIAQMRLQHPDVSFGHTQVIFNDGVTTTTTSGTGKTQIHVDIRKNFNESNYHMQFLGNSWSSTTDESGQKASIGSYLGFNQREYYGTSIMSQRLSTPSDSSANTSSTFETNASNLAFRIVVYKGGGSSYDTRATTYDTVFTPIDIVPNISSSFGYLVDATGNYQLTRDQLKNVVDTALKSTVALDANFSGLYWRDISGLEQSYQGNSYFEMELKINAATYAPMVGHRDVKMAVLFPTTSTIYVGGTNSAFQFPDFYGNSLVTIDNKSYVVLECSDLYGEVPVLQSNFSTEANTIIRLKCTRPGYTDASLQAFDASATTNPNNYNISLTPGNNNLSEYLKMIGDSFSSASLDTSGSSFVLDPSNFVHANILVNRVFPTNLYRATLSGNLITQIFGQINDVDLSGQNVFDISSNPYQLTTNIVLTDNDELAIKSKKTDPPAIVHGNETAPDFVVSFSTGGTTLTSINQLLVHLNSRLAQYSSPNASWNHPLANSNVSYNSTTGFKLTIEVNDKLSYKDYTLDFTDASNVATKLHFDTSYTLLNYPSSAQPATFSDVSSNETVSNQVITIDSSNGSIVFSPDPSIVGLQTSNDLYKVTLTVPTGSYNIISLQNTLNTLLTANPITAGSTFSVFSYNNQLFTKLRLNINQYFTTKDFRLVFYDPFSFITCTSGVRKKIQNVSWDTTLGWILGFREFIIYYLVDYVGLTYSYGTTALQYYLTGTHSNVCVLKGDTATNTNLYNYFLIVVDDFLQNHLNDGLVRVSSQETRIVPQPYKLVCDPATQQLVPRPLDYDTPGKTYTARQLASFQEKVRSVQAQENSYSRGPYVKDVFSMIPLKTGPVGGTFTEFGGTLQNQDRMYFGPVNIHRLSIKLMNDRGDIVDLNGMDWNFALVCEQLYRNTAK